jgi:hypothetical protein
VLVIVVAATGLHPAAIAQTKANETLSDTFERTYFNNDPNFYQNRSFKQQLNWMFGINGFSDNEINRDAAQIHELWQTSLKQQTASDPVIRTRDLPNPYNTSILSSPQIDVNQSTQGDELIFEKQ